VGSLNYFIMVAAFTIIIFPLYSCNNIIYIYIEGVCQDLILSCIKTTPMALSGEHSKKKQSANEQCVYVYICVHDGSG
jgi:hypothetical protein